MAGVVLALVLVIVVGGCGDSTKSTPDGSLVANHEGGPPPREFTRPREVIVGRDTPVTAALVTFEATPDHLAVLYAVAGEIGFAAAPGLAELVNDKGDVYAKLSNIAVGAPEGVFVGMLVTEPYRPGSRSLTLRLDELTDKSGQPVELGLELPVATRNGPDEPVDFYEGGRYGHDAGIRIKNATVGVAGPPATSATHALVVRDNHASAVHAVIEEGGVARVVPAGQAAKPPLPPEFPWPSGVPY